HYREDEFTYGDKILICPVLEPGVSSRTLYLPKGSWFNYWTDENVDGGKEITVPTPLDSMPIFVKAGSVIPEYPVMQYVGEKEIDELKLNVYHTNYEVNSFVFEDYGETFAYEQDIYLEKKFVVNGTKDQLVIHQSIEGLYTPRYENYDFHIIGLPFEVSKVVVDGRLVENFATDENGHLVFKSNKNFKEIHLS